MDFLSFTKSMGKNIGKNISKTLRGKYSQNNSETSTNEHDKEIPKERYISSEERQKIIDHRRLI